MSSLTISVAMATYNGAKYLEDQLFSIARQTRLPDEMVISDDGSTDETVGILEQFSVNSPFPVRIYRNQQPMGYGDNFMKAASLCMSELIAFCDQDDVWIENRLATCLSYFSDEAVVLSVHSGVVVDDNLQPLGSMWPDISRTKVCYESEPNKFPYPGFAIVVRKDIPGFFLKPRPPEMQGLSREMPHDNWVSLLARIYGKIAFIEEPLVLYRRHQTTTTVIQQYSTSDRIHLSSKCLSSEEYRKTADWLGLLVDCFLDIDINQPYSRLSHSSVAILRYRRQQQAYADRARLYAIKAPFTARLWTFVIMIIRGRYLSAKWGNLGLKSFLKDCTILFVF
jgi:glycosyltransferase involved in cell wall biosynthesis